MVKVRAEINRIENKEINRERQWNQKQVFEKVSEIDRPLVSVTKKK